MVEIKEINNRVDWNNIINQFENYSPYQIFEWGEYKKKWGYWKILNLYFNNNGKIGCVQILYKIKFKIFFGWIVGTINGDFNCFNKTILINYLKSKFRVIYLYLRANFHNSSYPELTFSLTCNEWKRCSKKIISDYTYHLNLKKDDDEILKTFSSNWRKNLKKGEKLNNFTKILLLSESNTNEIVQLFEEFQEIKEIPIPEKKEVDIIKKILGNYIVIGFSKIENKLAGLRAFIYYKKIAIDFWAATNNLGRKNFTSYSLLWHLIKKAKNMDIEKYDLAGIDPINNQSVYNFKKGLRGKLIEKCGEWELSSSPALSFTVNNILLNLKKFN
jgi:lipid II:glycine glycyltransferase (peptidoglycan interpeptide bridge formation enzyme)